ncbi:MAG: acetyl-CoA carboxylase biotin carboxyl carrier protein [Gemmatimonadetes bacterium]|nr:acetyl-CoA carboxylase biotin carboxyl carrier protein [Gemmatimonadota bacterium]
MDLDWIRRLIDMVDGSGIDSLEISRFGKRVRIAKSPPVTVTTAAAGAAPAPAAMVASAPPAAAALAAEAVADEPATESGLAEVNSPMVGTFYRAPAPDAPAYVETGDRVEKGQTICILEAMKLMNELEAEVSGTIREICVENAEPVEFGQVLFRIDPA